MSLVVNAWFRIPLDEIQVTYARSSGPGGQNVNKVASKALLRWSLTESSLPPEAKERFSALYPSFLTNKGEVVIQSQIYRDAPKNRLCCLEKLRRMLLNALLVPKKRIPTRPTLGSVRRRLASKARQSDKKQCRRFTPGED